MFAVWSVVLYFVLFINALEERESRVVKTTQGPVRVYKDEKEDLFVFHGIPYATAPTGKYRFRPPLPAPIWVNTFEAIDKGIVCPQSDFILQNYKDYNIQEDCLIANIFVPATKKDKLPVYVYVHGGGYWFGFGNLNTPKGLVASQQIVAVTFNYRLGPHGFLCLGTPDVPGNAGMKDQVALLRWVKKNIASFGGDPDNITIGGGSAGSSSVDLLMISKLTDGLFNKVIPESGANTAIFSIQSNPIESAKEYARLRGFHGTEHLNELEEFYLSLPYDQLSSNIVVNRTDSTFLLFPCVERQNVDEAFLKDDAVNILKSGDYKKLPMLYGFANMEGLFRVAEFDTWKEPMNENFADYLPPNLEFNTEQEKKEVAKKVKKFYFKNEKIDEEVILEYINYYSDIIIAYPTLLSVKLQVEAGNNRIYLYDFSYTAESWPVVPHTNVRGAPHCAQTMAVMDDFATDAYRLPASEEFDQIRVTLRKIWLNFILTGKPIPEDSDFPEWPPVGSDRSPHMNFDKNMELRGPLLKERAEFWDGIYDKYYRRPVPPPKLQKYSEEL